MAAEAAAKAGGGAMTVATGGGAPQIRAASPSICAAFSAPARAPMTITNRGDTPAWRTVSITGVPAADLPAESRGYAVSRSVFRPDGTAADLSKVRQTDLFVVVIKGTRTDASQSAQTLVVDLLPAGFEIETATVSKGRSTTDYSWLPELDRCDLHRAARRPLHRRARPQRRRQGLHPRLCRPRRHTRRVQIPGARRRGHVRARDHRAHRDRQADRRCAVEPRHAAASCPLRPPAGEGGDPSRSAGRVR